MYKDSNKITMCLNNPFVWHWSQFFTFLFHFPVPIMFLLPFLSLTVLVYSWCPINICSRKGRASLENSVIWLWVNGKQQSLVLQETTAGQRHRPSFGPLICHLTWGWLICKTREKNKNNWIFTENLCSCVRSIFHLGAGFFLVIWMAQIQSKVN